MYTVHARLLHTNRKLHCPSSVRPVCKYIFSQYYSLFICSHLGSEINLFHVQKIKDGCLLFIYLYLMPSLCKQACHLFRPTLIYRWLQKYMSTNMKSGLQVHERRNINLCYTHPVSLDGYDIEPLLPFVSNTVYSVGSSLRLCNALCVVFNECLADDIGLGRHNNNLLERILSKQNIRWSRSIVLRVYDV